MRSHLTRPRRLQINLQTSQTIGHECHTRQNHITRLVCHQFYERVQTHDRVTTRTGFITLVVCNAQGDNRRVFIECAHLDESTRMIYKLLRSKYHNRLDEVSLNKYIPVDVFYKSSKHTEEVKWIVDTAVEAGEHIVKCTWSNRVRG